MGGPFLRTYLFFGGDMWCGTRYVRRQGSPVSMASMSVTSRNNNWTRGDDHGRVI
jgi:hypothetical protein